MTFVKKSAIAPEVNVRKRINSKGGILPKNQVEFVAAVYVLFTGIYIKTGHK
jgi:hypothetical protein